MRGSAFGLFSAMHEGLVCQCLNRLWAGASSSCGTKQVRPGCISSRMRSSRACREYAVPFKQAGC